MRCGEPAGGEIEDPPWDELGELLLLESGELDGLERMGMEGFALPAWGCRKCSLFWLGGGNNSCGGIDRGRAGREGGIRVCTGEGVGSPRGSLGAPTSEDSGPRCSGTTCCGWWRIGWVLFTGSGC